MADQTLDSGPITSQVEVLRQLKAVLLAADTSSSSELLMRDQVLELEAEVRDLTGSLRNTAVSLIAAQRAQAAAESRSAYLTALNAQLLELIQQPSAALDVDEAGLVEADDREPPSLLRLALGEVGRFAAAALVMAATGVLPGLGPRPHSGSGRGGECIPLHLTLPRGPGQPLPELSSGDHVSESTGGSGPAGMGYGILASLRAAQATAAALMRGLVLQPAPTVWSDSGGSGGAEQGGGRGSGAGAELFSWRAALGLALLAQALVWQRSGWRMWAGLLRGAGSETEPEAGGAGVAHIGLVADGVDSDSDSAADAGDAATVAASATGGPAVPVLRPAEAGALASIPNGTAAPAALVPSPLLSKAARRRLAAAAGGGGRCGHLLPGLGRLLLPSAGGGFGGVRGWVAAVLQLCSWFAVTWALRALHTLLLRVYDAASPGAVYGAAARGGDCRPLESSSDGAVSAPSSWPLLFALHPAALLLSSYVSLRLAQAAAVAVAPGRARGRQAGASGVRAAGPAEQSRVALANDAANGAWATEAQPGSQASSSTLPALAAALRLLRGVLAPALRVFLLLLAAAVTAQHAAAAAGEVGPGGSAATVSAPSRIADLSEAWVGLQRLLHATALWPLLHTPPGATSGGAAADSRSSGGVAWAWTAAAVSVLALHALFAASLALDVAAAERDRAAAAEARRQAVRLAAQRSQLRRITAGQGRGDRAPADGRAHTAGTAARAGAAAPGAAASPTVSLVAPASAAGEFAREEALLREGVARCSAELASAAAAAARATTSAWVFATSLAAAACLLAWALASSSASGVSAAAPPDGAAAGASAAAEPGPSGAAWSAFALCACVVTHPALLGAAVLSEALLAAQS